MGHPEILGRGAARAVVLGLCEGSREKAAGKEARFALGFLSELKLRPPKKAWRRLRCGCASRWKVWWGGRRVESGGRATGLYSVLGVFASTHAPRFVLVWASRFAGGGGEFVALLGSNPHPSRETTARRMGHPEIRIASFCLGATEIADQGGESAMVWAGEVDLPVRR
jgi:hypothetical protein